MAEEKLNKKYGIRNILKEVIENELKNAEVIMKDEVNDLNKKNCKRFKKKDRSHKNVRRRNY